MDEVKEKFKNIWRLKNIKIPHRRCLMYPQKPADLILTNVNLVKVRLTGGEISKLLWMIWSWGQMFTSVDFQVQLMRKKKKERRGCIKNMETAKAHFPGRHLIRLKLNLIWCAKYKKRWKWINTLTPIVTFLLRWIQNVTSLLSGTAIKAIVAYISDYVTKPGLKTYTILTLLEVCLIRVLNAGWYADEEKTSQSLVTKNRQCSYGQTGNWWSYASLYLLGNPDHYTNSVSVVF